MSDKNKALQSLIINSPFEAPAQHWEQAAAGKGLVLQQGRRPAHRQGQQQAQPGGERRLTQAKDHHLAQVGILPQGGGLQRGLGQQGNQRPQPHGQQQAGGKAAG